MSVHGEMIDEVTLGPHEFLWVWRSWGEQGEDLNKHCLVTRDLAVALELKVVAQSQVPSLVDW